MSTIFGKSIYATIRFVTTLATATLISGASRAQSGNTATGNGDLYYNVSGSYNTADGNIALYHNITGSYNTGIGSGALFDNTSGTNNTGVGSGTLATNTTGHSNTANGSYALYANTTGYSNTATGYLALYSNSIGLANVAVGPAALYSNFSGDSNVALGISAGYQITGSNNIVLGPEAGYYLTSGSANIVIGNLGAASDTETIRIGTVGRQSQTFIAGINGVGVSGAVPVYINSSGQLGTVTSSQRFKYDIHNIGSTSDKLMDLRPVTFRYKEAADDGSHPLQYGLIAEEVAKVYPDLVQYDKQGKPFTVYYHLLTPIMLDQLQKAHRQLEAQRTELDSLKTIVQNTSSAAQTQNAGLQSQVTSLQHTVQLLLLFATAVVLAGLAGASIFAASRAGRLHSWRPRPVETCASV